VSVGAVDVAIAGAGPAGVAAALTLARRGFEVALIDRARFPRDKPCGEGLLPHAVAQLAALGLLARVRRRALRLDGIAFSVAGGPRAAAAFRDRDGRLAYGLGIARLELDALLLDAARAQPGVTVLEGVAALDVVRATASAPAGLRTSAGMVAARAVIACDGLRSRLRAALGLDAPARLAPRLGLRAHFDVPALPFGPRVEVILDGRVEYYVTPVAERRIEVCALGGRDAFAALGLAARHLAAQLARTPALGRVLDGARAVDAALGEGPLRRRARAVVADGVLLAGDAAGYVDAITGEGVGLALATGAAAGDQLGAALTGGDVSARALAGYARVHRALTRDAERFTRAVLFCAERPWLARRVVALLAARPALLERLLRLQAQTTGIPKPIFVS
jgi:flavin-dependent dehydrogenase